MKKTLLFLILIGFKPLFGQKKIFELINQAQSSNATSKSVGDLFSVSTNINAAFDRSEFRQNAALSELNLSRTTLESIVSSKPQLLNLKIPVAEKSSIDVVMIPINIFSPTFKVKNSKNEEVKIERGIYYQGIVKGDANSIVSLSFSKNEVAGIISTDKGNLVLGKLTDNPSYIIYNDKDVLTPDPFKCHVEDNLVTKIETIDNITSGGNVGCDTVAIYIEADSAIYKAQGFSLTSTSNFVNNLFSQVAVLYSNEDIQIQLSELKIWDTTDPYVGATTTNQMLHAFDQEVGEAFNGDLAQLISGRSLGGGLAWVNVLCNKGTGINTNIGSTVTNVPTYSWNVNILTHELGHNFGSPHTHACSWPGGAIDGCYTPEGSCPTGPTPTNGGTIMSYCQVTPYGVNFNNGFGPLPGNLIRSRVQSCFGSNVPPTNLVVLEVYAASALLAWEHSSTDQYTLEYKPSASGTWTAITTINNSYQITGLIPDTEYDWRVKVDCSDYTSSNFSTNNDGSTPYCNVSFTTGCKSGSIGIKDFIVESDNWNPSSGCSNSGYTFIYNTSHELIKDSTYNFTITPLWVGGNSVQAAIWIDLNKNGTFENTEKVFTTTSSTKNTIPGSFTIPASSPSQNKTRMRLILNYNSAPSSPCGNRNYGEAEDYYINISDACPTIAILSSPTDDYISGTTSVQVKSSGGSITAQNQILGTETRVNYEGASILLQPGFISEEGTVFEAKVGGCP